MSDSNDYRIPVLAAIPLCFLLCWTVCAGWKIFADKSASRSTATGLILDMDESLDDQALESVFQLRRIPVNSASLELLQTISGIGPALADRIIAERNESGPFSSAEDLSRAPGIGPKRIDQFQAYLRFD